MKKENLLVRFLNKIKSTWERLGEPDIEDGLVDSNTAMEVQKIIEVQEKVKKQKSFVTRVEKIDPLLEKYGEIKEGNPVYDAARKVTDTEKKIKSDDELLR